MTVRRVRIECRTRHEYGLVIRDFLLAPVEETPPPKKGIKRRIHEFLIKRGWCL